MEELVDEVYEAFVKNEWEFEAYGQPERGDVKIVVENCYERLKDKPDGTVIEVGNISMRKAGDRYDFYIRLGDFKENA